jgi:hypothetical protein
VKIQEVKHFDKNTFATLEKRYLEKLKEQLPTGQCRAVVIEIGNRIVSSGAFSITSLVPVPNDPQCKVANVHSSYTDKKYRKRGLADSILKRLFWYSSQEGKSIYKKNGLGKGTPMKICVV